MLLYKRFKQKREQTLEPEIFFREIRKQCKKNLAFGYRLLYNSRVAHLEGAILAV